MAVILVLLFHAGLGFSGGFVGVDVFFVISGFLITGLILKEQRAGTFRLSKFWARRIRRIVPASSVMVFATLIAGGFFLLPIDYEELGKSAIAQQLMLSNVFFWRNTGYFAGSADVMPLLHTWSLAVEEQFYLGYPFLLLFMKRFNRRTTAGVLGLAVVTSFAISEWGVRNHAGATFYLLPTRAWEMLLGGLLCFAPSPSKLKAGHAQLLSLAGMAAILAAGWCFDSATRFPGSAALVPCLGAALLIYSNSWRRTWAGQALAAKPMVFIGMISYSLYLWHWPLLAFMHYRLGEDLPMATSVAVLLASFGISCLSWRFIETPFRKPRALPQRRGVLIAACGTTLLLLTCSLTISFFDGFLSRLDPRASNYRAAKDSKQFLHEVTTGQVRRGDVPTFGALEGSLKCLVWGDSHAMALILGIDAACKNRGIRGYQVTHSATAPILDFAYSSKYGLNEKSPEFGRSVLDFAISTKVDLVIMSGIWSRYAKNQAFEARLRDTVDRLVAAGIRVAIVRDVAQHDDDVPMMLARTVLSGGDIRKLGVSLERHRERNKICDGIIDRVASGKAQVLDPAPFFVDVNGIWRIEFEGTSAYRDSGHLSGEGSLRLRALFEDLFESMSRTPDGGPVSRLDQAAR